VGAFISCYCAVQFFVLVLECRPVRAAWDPTVENPTCIQVNLMFMIMGSFNVLTDISTLCLPTPLLWQLQVSRERRMQLFSISMLGGL
jgi:hypothetical protein